MLESWEILKARVAVCKACDAACSPSLRESGSRPLIGRFDLWRNGAFFVFEAPNRADTFDPDKGYPTYDRDTDPTGRFTRRLLHEELQLDVRFFQVTNAVLCLPLADPNLINGQTGGRYVSVFLTSALRFRCHLNRLERGGDRPRSPC